MGKGRERERPRATKTKPKAAAKPKKPKAKAKTAKAPPKAAAKVPAKKVPKDRPGQEPDHEPPEPPEPPEDVDSDVGALTGNAALQTSPMGSRGLVSSAARHYLEEEELEHPSLAADLAEDSDEYSDDEQPELDKPSSGMDMRLEPLAAPRVRDGQRRSESGDPFAFARDALDSLDGGWSDGGQAVAGVSVSAVQNDALRALERFADIAFQPPPRIEPDGATTEPVQIERVPAGQKRPRAESKTESDREVCGSPAVSPVEGEASEGGEKTADAQPHAKRRKDGPPLDVPPAPPPSPSAFRRCETHLSAIIRVFRQEADPWCGFVMAGYRHRRAQAIPLAQPRSPPHVSEGKEWSPARALL